MKNSILTLVFLFFSVLTFANTDEIRPANEIQPKVVTNLAESLVKPLSKEADPSDVYCSVTYNGNTATCWFCDCNELLKTLMNGPQNPNDGW